LEVKDEQIAFINRETPFLFLSKVLGSVLAAIITPKWFQLTVQSYKCYFYINA